MPLEQDLEMAGGSVDMESKEAHHEVDEVTSIPHTDEANQGLDISEVAKKIEEIDGKVASISREAFLRCGVPNIAPALQNLYERNLHICTSVLIKDFIRTRDHSSKERQQVVEANLEKYAKTLRDYQFFEAFRKSNHRSFHLRSIVESGMGLARIEGYEEISDQIPACMIEEAKESVYGTYPFIGQGEGSSIASREGEAFGAVPEQVVAFLQRLKMSLFGGFVVVVPMLIMALDGTLLTALLTTSVFVLAVAVIIAIQMKTAEPKDVLGTTAAYAAVLVVFVGTTTTNMERSVIAAIVLEAILGGIIIVLTGAVVYTVRGTRKVENEEGLGERTRGVTYLIMVLRTGLLG